ncbi:MAG: hypothetical protein SH868_00365 [Bythopirellula sp.]|nr:hypothetical protein [Bythopirellula sp.]
MLTPLVDEYFDNKESRRALAEELENARQTAEQLPSLEKQVAAVVAELEILEGRSVSEDTVSAYRTRLVDMIRESSCQIRRLDLAQPIRRPWKEGDSPLVEGNKSDSSGKATPFSLERRGIQLSVSGRTHDIYTLLERLQKDTTLAHPERLQIHSDGQNGETVTMELEMLLFALSRQSS